MKKDKKWLKEEVNAQNIILDKGYIYTEDILKLIDQLEEPEQEKVVVPQFVADRIEEYREIRFGLSLIFTIDDQTEDDIDFSKWLSADSENCEKVARAWLDGYTVEKEKLYRVKLGNVYMLEDTLRHTLVEEKAHIFTSKSRADAVAVEVGGTVEEITE